MRRTRWTFAAALLLLALGVTRPPSGPVERDDRSLDFAGIERLDVESDGHVQIQVGGGAPSLKFEQRDPDVDVVVERRGDTLHVRISSGNERHHEGKLVVPATLERMDIRGGAYVEAMRPVRALRINTTRPLRWQGEARRLEIVRRPETPEPATGGATAASGGDATGDGEADSCDCLGVVSVTGAIDELFVTADEGRVSVDRAGGHGHVTLDLADGVRFDLDNAMDLEGVTLVRRPARERAPAADAEATDAGSTVHQSATATEPVTQ
jgi:hypothetical protein